MLIAGGGCGHRPTLHRVTIHGFTFDPARLEVARGDTIEWTNRDILPHTATALSGRWDSKSLGPGASWRLVASTAGAEPYQCVFHPTMQARIEAR